MEWTFKKAITIQTYSSYDPIPVPLNLVPVLLWGFGGSGRNVEGAAKDSQTSRLLLHGT